MRWLDQALSTVEGVYAYRTRGVSDNEMGIGMRGFSEALRRELGDSTVRVHYLAPRATRTGINSAEVEQMNAELGVAMDAVSTVAAAACRMLENEATETVVG